ncbi:hypothetical protein [Sporosarcina sp. Te-1]|uniref:hypothetical protein n=1 Tax=Sporosarcina sp. Te-1 TaxID=2818390 RepID=UPI001A9CC297|nr:hypothetical protein [Sporosarcina sp. Te-1]QTD42086.1 hypothetical protein J3U78_04435 [Sporosarcina sp. Te-1]
MSIHDGLVIGYKMDFIENELEMQILTVQKEVVIVRFNNYLAHEFSHVMKESIVFDIEEQETEKFIKENQTDFERHQGFNWPLPYNNVEELTQLLFQNEYKCYIIFSSSGLSGYVIAKSIAID